MMFTVPIGARRRRRLDAFYAHNKERLGAAIGGSDCHYGARDIGQVLTAFEGDFRTAVQLRTTRPQKGRARDAIPAGLALRQQWRALVEVPPKRGPGPLFKDPPHLPRGGPGVAPLAPPVAPPPLPPPAP